MALPKIQFKHKWALSLVFLVLSLSNVNAHEKLGLMVQQDTTLIKPSDKAEQLYQSKKYEEVLAFCKQKLLVFLNKEVKDSLQIAYLNYYQFETQFKFENYFESIKSANQGIKYSPNSQEGLELKGILYYKKAYGEKQLAFIKRSNRSMQAASNFLSQLEIPNDDYVIGAYNFLSQNAAYDGDLEEAQRFLRLSKKTYLNNKTAIDIARTDQDGNYDRYQVILQYKNIYNLYKRGESEKDSLNLIKLINEFEVFHNAPEFNAKYERVYYTTALNHVGDWYASHKVDTLVTTSDLKKANYYLDKSIDLVENKGYPGNKITFKYNKCKALTLANNLEQADILISELLSSISKKDKRNPFFLAQKGLIKAKLKQKDSALIVFYNTIEKVHSGEEKLNKSFSNFKPNESFGETKLLIKIAETLNKHYKKDKGVQTLVAQLYYMSLMQFENSYNDTKFNTTDNAYLRKIIFGILKMKQKGYGHNLIKNETLLNQFETVKNQLAWQQFNQNRYINNLPRLDSLKQRRLSLRSLLVSAKSTSNIEKQDSLYVILNKTKKQINTLYPNLNLLSEKHFEISDLQKKLASHQLVIKYIVLDKQIAICKITKNDLIIELKPWTEKENTLVTTFTKSAKNQEFNSDVAIKLAKLLLPEISKNSTHIIFNPDGDLYQLPFETLKIDNQFLIENYKLSYTSNLGFIYPELEKNSNDQELAIYIPSYTKSNIQSTSTTREDASSLIGALKEGNAIAKLFPSKIYSDATLTKQEFIATAEKASLLHLAMHAKVNNKEPGLSRLLFNVTNDVSKDLYLEELYALSLSADLAVLSACNTGLGKEDAGKSMESFQRAFTFAGVPATVASLWEVPDKATKQIMERFYKHLSNGLSKSKALQNAKQEYIKVNANTKLAQPYFWAGFVLYGEDKAVAIKELNPIWYGLILFCALSVTIVLFFKYKNRQSA